MAGNFQRREWLIQRAGWLAIALAILAGAAGVFGDGPLADVRLEGNGIRLEYERFARMEAPNQWRLTVVDTPAGGRLEIGVDASLVSNYRFTEIHPEPRQVRATGTRWVYEFAVEGGNSPIVFHAQALHAGRYRGDLRIGASPPVRLSQYIYP